MVSSGHCSGTAYQRMSVVSNRGSRQCLKMFKMFLSQSEEDVAWPPHVPGPLQPLQELLRLNIHKENVERFKDEIHYGSLSPHSYLNGFGISLQGVSCSHSCNTHHPLNSPTHELRYQIDRRRTGHLRNGRRSTIALHSEQKFHRLCLEPSVRTEQ